MEATTGIAWSSLVNDPIFSQSHQCCSSFAASCPRRNVLIIGAERPDEFADALLMRPAIGPHRGSHSAHSASCAA